MTANEKSAKNARRMTNDVPVSIQGNDALDTDTRLYGIDPPFEHWEGDGTGMVHVLWSAKHRGLTLERDCDEIMHMVMRSRWLRAREHFAAERTSPDSDTKR